MKLSDGIATGRVLLIPTAGVLNDKAGRGCAWGMALAAKGVNAVCFPELSEVAPEWAWTLYRLQELPCICGHHKDYVQGIIVHLFNCHVMHVKDWTLDQLIDWVRSVEPAEAQADQLEAIEAMRIEEYDARANTR